MYSWPERLNQCIYSLDQLHYNPCSIVMRLLSGHPWFSRELPDCVCARQVRTTEKNRRDTWIVAAFAVRSPICSETLDPESPLVLSGCPASIRDTARYAAMKT